MKKVIIIFSMFVSISLALDNENKRVTDCISLAGYNDLNTHKNTACNILFPIQEDDSVKINETQSILLVNYKNSELRQAQNSMQKYPYAHLTFYNFVHDEESAYKYLNTYKQSFLGDQKNKYSKIITSFVESSIEIFSSNENYDEYMRTFFNVQYAYHHNLNPTNIFDPTNPWRTVDYCCYIVMRWQDKGIFNKKMLFIPWSELYEVTEYLSDIVSNKKEKLKLMKEALFWMRCSEHEDRYDRWEDCCVDYYFDNFNRKMWKYGLLSSNYLFYG